MGIRTVEDLLYYFPREHQDRRVIPIRELVPGKKAAFLAEVVSAEGVRLNLIFNGEPRPDGGNVLLDEERRWPGYTHAAFVVDRLQSVIDWAAARAIPITEGPHDWGRRFTCFLRDPDGNVLEFNELK